MQLETIAIFTVGLAAIWVPITCLSGLTNSMSTSTADAQGDNKLYEKVRLKAQQLFEKVSLLETHASDYFNTLHESGLGTLISMRNQMNVVITDLHELHSAGRYEDVYELSKFLLTPAIKSYPRVAKLTSAKLEVLDDWEQRSNEYVISCVIRLSVMSAKTQTIGVQRAHKRRPTVHSLEELKKALGEFRPSN